MTHLSDVDVPSRESTPKSARADSGSVPGLAANVPLIFRGIDLLTRRWRTDSRPASPWSLSATKGTSRSPHMPVNEGTVQEPVRFMARSRQHCRNMLSTLFGRWLVAPKSEANRTRLRGSQGSGSRSGGSRSSGPQSGDILLSSSRSREVWIHVVLAGIGLVLGLRLVWIQGISSKTFAARAHRQQVSQERIPSRPGDILDRHGRLLATTIAVPSLYVNPQAVTDRARLADRLSILLQMDASELRARLEKYSDRQFLWIRRRLSDQEAAAFRKLKLPVRVASLRREFQRIYPQQQLAAHVLGIRNIDGDGRGGVEEWFDDQLRGHDGIRRYVRDARGYVLDVLEEVTSPPENGTSLVLTIDAVLQLHVERQLDALMKKHAAQGACAVAIDPQSGEILALASRPTFHPNHPEDAEPSDWKNLATAATFEPGSTFKPLVVAWALQQGVIHQEERFHCENGAYRMGRRILHDHHRYGNLSVSDILVKSSNIGMAKIGERLGNDQLFQLASAFGFGRRTGIELPGELAGILRPLKDWNSYSTGSIPMGHEISATPMQMLAAHAVLANRGQRVSPHLLLKTMPAASGPRPAVVSRVVEAEPCDWLVQGPLVDVVEHGTGRLAKLPGETVFGKTGTAQKTLQDEQGYSSSRHVSSFIGGIPAGDPRLLVLISVDEPQGADQFGGSVAAPYVAAILKAGLTLLDQAEPAPAPVQLVVDPELIHQE